jgi:hypothetical protein
MYCVCQKRQALGGARGWECGSVRGPDAAAWFQPAMRGYAMGLGYGKCRALHVARMRLGCSRLWFNVGLCEESQWVYHMSQAICAASSATRIKRHSAPCQN